MGHYKEGQDTSKREEWDAAEEVGHCSLKREMGHCREREKWATAERRVVRHCREG